ncbi:unnamed protein product, partial [Owenia fusiformis]
MAEFKRNIPVFTKTDLTVGAVFGEGGFGSVYVGKLEKLHQRVAVKVFKANRGETISERHRNMLIKEANHMFDARHPNVVHIFGIVLETDYYAIVMDFCPTGSVKTLLKHYPDTSIRLRYRILHQVAIAMNFLHQMNPIILHLDLKAENVLLDSYCNVKLCDFGLSKARKEITSTSVTSKGGFGTVTHMSPQQLENSKSPTKQDDVYSFGILIWEVFTSGMQPYEDNRYHEILVGVAILQMRPKPEFLLDTRKDCHLEELYILMKKCYTHNPSERPTFDECAVSLEGFLDTDERKLQLDVEKATEKVKAKEQLGTYNNESKIDCQNLTEAVSSRYIAVHQHEDENEAEHDVVISEHLRKRSKHSSNTDRGQIKSERSSRSTASQLKGELVETKMATDFTQAPKFNRFVIFIVLCFVLLLLGLLVFKPNQTSKCAEKAEL